MRLHEFVSGSSAFAWRRRCARSTSWLHELSRASARLAGYHLPDFERWTTSIFGACLTELTNVIVDDVLAGGPARAMRRHVTGSAETRPADRRADNGRKVRLARVLSAREADQGLRWPGLKAPCICHIAAVGRSASSRERFHAGYAGRLCAASLARIRPVPPGSTRCQPFLAQTGRGCGRGRDAPVGRGPRRRRRREGTGPGHGEHDPGSPCERPRGLRAGGCLRPGHPGQVQPAAERRGGLGLHDHRAPAWPGATRC